MNYTIYENPLEASGTNGYTIESQNFTSEPISLVEISCLSESNYGTLFNDIKTGKLKIQYNEIDLNNGLPIISQLIELSTGNTEIKNDKLLEDWIEWSDILTITEGDIDLIEIEKGYSKRIKDGFLYYRQKRAQLVKLLNLGQLSSSEVFLIDTKIKDTKDCIMSGDWQTGYLYLSQKTVEGAFTEEYKNLLLSELGEYISLNY